MPSAHAFERSFTYTDQMDEPAAPDEAPHATSSEPPLPAPLPAPRSSRPIVLPLVALLLLTLLTQLGSLPFIIRRNAQIPDGPDHSLQFLVIETIVVVFLLTIPLAGLGLLLGRRVGLGAPLLTDLLQRRPGAGERLRLDAKLAIPLGLVVGVIVRFLIMPYLPPERLALEHPPAWAALLVSAGAGVAEETWCRLGLMTIFAWLLARLLGHGEIRPVVAWPANVLAALVFGLMHLPQLSRIAAPTSTAIAAVLLGNGIVGVALGWLYWRRSLVAAILAHFAADVMLHVLPAMGL